MRCIILQRKFFLGGPSLPHFPKHFPHYTNNTSAHRTGECVQVGVPDKLQHINRCTHTEMETIERQRHEVIALINVLYSQRGQLNDQWHVGRAFCFSTLIGCFHQRLFGFSLKQNSGKWQLARLEEPFLEPPNKDDNDGPDRQSWYTN